MNRNLRKLDLGKNILKSVCLFSVNEIKRGTFLKNIRGVSKTEIIEEMSWGELLEEKAARYRDKIFLMFEDKTFTYRQMNENANRMANYFLSKGAGQGKGVAILMDNSPSFIDIFIGIQKIGMFAVPVNTSLKGDSLLYILNHCDAKYLVIDESHLETLKKIADRLENIKTIIVNPSSSSPEKYPAGYHLLDEAYKESPVSPGIGYRKDDICFITYTSGTTGLPKGVVYRYRKSSVKLLSLVAVMLFKKSDVLYTGMPLFHGNALFVTVTNALHVGARVVLAKKFSASRFWDDIRKYNVTTFNTIGAMIPIMMKQPEKPTDRQHKVRFIISAACPADLWEKFEKRFGLAIYETYGAVDGGGKIILNLGTAPVGSIGKPPMKVKYRLVDTNMNDVPDGTPGELVFPISNKKSTSSVEYYKNEKASAEKMNGGFIFTGDLIRRDAEGFLYFIGRNTESMRIKGENVSAFEVEQAIQKHPNVLEAAVYAVPSELAEDDIMASLTLVEGMTLKETDLIEYLKENLPKFAVPRYVKIVPELPKTETHRVKKKELEVLKVVSGTWDENKLAYL
ncbi:MAG: AMP-binding protein [Deltaproteobacteria bacterium]|nr:AMP-binding protein [Deltaproteobacteria bacterium]